MPHHTTAVGGHFHPRNRCDTLRLRSAFPPAIWNCREGPLCPAAQALSLINTQARIAPHAKSRLTRVRPSDDPPIRSALEAVVVHHVLDLRVVLQAVH